MDTSLLLFVAAAIVAGIAAWLEPHALRLLAVAVALFAAAMAVSLA